MFVTSIVTMKFLSIFILGPTIVSFILTIIFIAIISLKFILIVPYKLLMAMFIIISFCILIVLFKKMKTTLENKFKQIVDIDVKQKIITLPIYYEIEPFLPVHFEFLTPKSSSIFKNLMNKKYEKLINNDQYKTLISIDINRTPMHF